METPLTGLEAEEVRTLHVAENTTKGFGDPNNQITSLRNDMRDEFKRIDQTMKHGIEDRLERLDEAMQDGFQKNERDIRDRFGSIENWVLFAFGVVNFLL